MTRLIDLSNFTTMCWWLSLIPCSVFRLEKKEDSEENSEDASEGDPEENTDKLWNKSTKLIATTIRYDSRIAISVASIVFPACHVSKSYSVDPVSFFRWARRGPRRGSSTKIKKSNTRPHHREKGM